MGTTSQRTGILETWTRGEKTGLLYGWSCMQPPIEFGGDDPIAGLARVTELREGRARGARVAGGLEGRVELPALQDGVPLFVCGYRGEVQRFRGCWGRRGGVDVLGEVEEEQCSAQEYGQQSEGHCLLCCHFFCRGVVPLCDVLGESVRKCLFARTRCRRSSDTDSTEHRTDYPPYSPAMIQKIRVSVMKPMMDAARLRWISLQRPDGSPGFSGAFLISYETQRRGSLGVAHARAKVRYGGLISSRLTPVCCTTTAVPLQT